MLEAKVEKYLDVRVQQFGGFTRKLEWIGRRGAPDRIVFLNRQVFFVELKAPGKKAAPHQAREHERMRAQGAKVWVADSFDAVDALLEEVMEHV